MIKGRRPVCFENGLHVGIAVKDILERILRIFT